MLVTLTTTCDEYKKLFVETIDALTKLSYLAKCQGQFLKTKKENKQGLKQSYWEILQKILNSSYKMKSKGTIGAKYCTLHPVVIYILDNERLVKHDPLCFISNDNTHDTAFVYEVQTKMAEYIKDKYPHIEDTLLY